VDRVRARAPGVSQAVSKLAGRSANLAPCLFHAGASDVFGEDGAIGLFGATAALVTVERASFWLTRIA